MASDRRDERFELLEGGDEPGSTLADDVREGFDRRPRSIPPKHFYDEVGAALFDQICELPEYYLTRAERALLEAWSDTIVELAGAPAALIELGSGMARKTGLLLAAMAKRVAAPLYVPLDIAPPALEASARALLAAHPTVRVRAIVGDFGRDLPRVVAPTAAHAPRLFAFLGSTIGNLDEQQAPALVRSIAGQMASADSFLLGFDLVKDGGVLHRAYDDAAGVTARFNLNVLAVVNRALDADFDLARWDHEARWVPERARIEMHLRSRGAQQVHVRALGLEASFADGETILTEISRKFTAQSVESTLGDGGMRLLRLFEHPGEHAFGLALARRA